MTKALELGGVYDTHERISLSPSGRYSFHRPFQPRFSFDAGSSLAGPRPRRDSSGASAQAQGFRFSYAVEGVAQEGEVLVFKRGARCYTLSYYTRSTAAQENRPAYEGIAGSLEVL